MDEDVDDKTMDREKTDNDNGIQWGNASKEVEMREYIERKDVCMP